jgi:hypothetical protein
MADHRHPRPESSEARRPIARHLLIVLAACLLVTISLGPRAAGSAELSGSPAPGTTPVPTAGASPDTALTLSPAPADPGSAATASEGPPDDDDVDEEYAEEDEFGLAEIYPSCVNRDRRAEAQVNSSGWDTTRGGLVWTLERDGVEIIREPFESFDGEYMGPHHLDDLEVGRYTLLVITAIGGQLVDWMDFEILECVTAAGGCRGVTFTNPPGNPALDITYGAGEDDESDDEPFDDRRTFTLPAGQSRTVSTQRRIVGWEASRVFPKTQRKSFGGEEYDLGVSQHCGETMTRATIRCAAGARATVDFRFSPPRDLPVQFKLLDFHEPVASGPVGSDRHLRLTLPSSDGLYSLRAYTADAVLPYDLMYFEVEPCLRVQPICRGLILTNPHEYATYTVRYFVDDGPHTTIKIGAGRTKQITVPEGSAVTWTRPHGSEVDGWPEFLVSEPEGGTSSPRSRC